MILLLNLFIGYNYIETVKLLYNGPQYTRFEDITDIFSGTRKNKLM